MAKKLVRGDYKSGRVQDPTAKLTSKHEKTVKNFVKDFMDRAMKKKVERDKEKEARVERKAQDKATGHSAEVETPGTPSGVAKEEKDGSDDEMLGLSDREEEDSHQVSPTDSTSELKRKREEESDLGSPKKTKTELPLAPPPPPPPPADNIPFDSDESLFSPG